MSGKGKNFIIIPANDALFFNHEDIDKVVFTGYVDEEEHRYLEIYDNGKKSMQNQD